MNIIKKIPGFVLFGAIVMLGLGANRVLSSPPSARQLVHAANGAMDGDLVSLDAQGNKQSTPAMVVLVDGGQWFVSDFQMSGCEKVLRPGVWLCSFSYVPQKFHYGPRGWVKDGTPSRVKVNAEFKRVTFNLNGVKSLPVWACLDCDVEALQEGRQGQSGGNKS
jgi:hypothetical protein